MSIVLVGTMAAAVRRPAAACGAPGGGRPAERGGPASRTTKGLLGVWGINIRC